MRTDQQWHKICTEAESMLLNKEVKTITQAAKKLNVSDLMIRRKAKKLGINLNIRGQGVAKNKNEQPSETDLLWNTVIAKKAV